LKNEKLEQKHYKFLIFNAIQFFYFLNLQNSFTTYKYGAYEISAMAKLKKKNQPKKINEEIIDGKLKITN
jgi:hypothetical protein